MTVPGGGVLSGARRLVGPRGRPIARHAADALLASRLGSITKVQGSDGRVSLTFDDGPDPIWTPRVLDALATGKSAATFFVLLDRARQHPELVRQAVEEGHEVGLHGADHRSLVGSSRSAVRDVLGRARAELEEVTSTPVRHFRPPYGAQNIRSYLGARDAGLECVMWGPCGWDWLETTPEEVTDRVLGETTAGDIVLLHDGLVMPETERRLPPNLDRAEVTSLVIAGLERQGLRSSTVASLRGSGETHRTAWFRG